MKKELLESEIKHYELLLKWYGIPLYVFLSGIGALVWLFLDIMKKADEYSILNLSVWAIVVSSSVWKIFRFDFQKITSEDYENTLKAINPFMPNLSRTLFLEIVLDLVCLFWAFQEFESVLFFYVFILFFVLSIFIHACALSVDSFLNILESSGVMPVIKKNILNKFRFVHFFEIFSFIVYLYFIYMVSEKVGFSLPFFKLSILLAGISLISKFYLDSNQYIVILTEKRKALNEILK